MSRSTALTWRRVTLSAAAVAVTCMLGVATPMAAGAATAGDTGDTSTTPATDFYTPPSPLPRGNNGDIIRHEASQLFVTPLKVAPVDANVRRMMYRSTDTHGKAIAVTGTVLTPKKAWRGQGQRPLVALSAGTQGVGDHCAPSKLMPEGTEYEGVFISGMLDKGYAVAVTDYEGLGTPGDHTYMNRASQAHTVLDGVRAAQRLPEAGVPDNGPVAFYGYSQGGGASAAAAEMQPSYAPELDVKGTYAGAPPANLVEVAKKLDGSMYVGYMGFALIGLQQAYPELDIEGVMNDKGKQLVAEARNECVWDSLKHAFTKSTDLTEDGRSVVDYMNEEPYRSRVDAQRIGKLKPSAPVFIGHSSFDDVVPYEQGKQLARDWCAKGATVQFNTYVSPTHVASAVAIAPDAMSYIADRFAGKPATNSCGRI